MAPCYARAADIRRALAHGLAPPADIGVHRAAEKVRILSNPAGGYSGPWRNAITPYLVGPMAALDDPLYDEIVFVGPGQCGKTEIGLNWLARSVVFDPADTLVVLDEKDQVNDFALRRMDRLISASPEVRSRLNKSGSYQYRFQGMLVSLLWATGSKAAAKSAPRIWMSERDSMADDLDGEGDPVDLFKKRMATFGASAKMFIESSPKKPVRKSSNNGSEPDGRHYPPATSGIVARYARGTMKRWYWPCPHCEQWHTPQWSDIRIDPEARAGDDAIEAALICPHCGCLISEQQKQEMMKSAAEGDRQGWVGVGETIDARGRIAGRLKRTLIDSYWLSGLQSSFVSWQELARKSLAAEEEFKRTGEESPRKTFYQLDLAAPYEPLSAQGVRLDESGLLARAEDYALRVIPAGAVFVTVSVDVQRASFQAMALAWGRGQRCWVIDRWSIEVAGERAVSPASHPEDWDLLKPIWSRAYPRAGGGEARPACVAIDTGGEDGVTTNAKAFRARLRSSGVSRRQILLVKGDHGRNIPMMRASNPDLRLTRQAAAGGDTQVTLLDADKFKGIVHSRLKRQDPGDGYIHLSRDLPDSVFLELTAESYIAGKWVRIRQRNESFDLLCYNLAAAYSIGLAQIDWDKPPPGRFALFEGKADAAAPPPLAPRRLSSRSSFMGRRAGRMAGLG